MVCALSTTSVYAAAGTKVTVVLPEQVKAYTPGNTINISWTPSYTRVQTVSLIPVKKGGTSGYVLHSILVGNDPIITSGAYNYTLTNYSIPTGSYYVGITLANSDEMVLSKTKIKIENKPSLYFGTQNGEVNSVAISSGKSITLKWDASSVDKCEASSFPKNSKWKNSVKASGTKKIRVATPTTFYLTCKNNLGEVTSSLKVDTGAPEYSNATLVPSSSFTSYTYKLGTSQQVALSNDQSITLFNASASETIYFRIITDDQPSWINSGYNTAQMTIPPLGVMGIGAFADPSKVTKPGTYTWDLKLEGNFSNSPLKIPITMTITK
jgi:hypothetical protein